jgi:hypothetical protein
MDQAGWLAAGQQDYYLFECPRAESNLSHRQIRAADLRLLS